MSIGRLAVFGGTFDPVHVGHLVAASEALNALRADRLLFVPAGRPWQKDRYSDPEDRFLMTSLAARLHPSFASSRIELDRRGPTYTIDTLMALREFHGPATKLFFIAGTDAVNGLTTWHRADEIRDLATIVAVNRPGVPAVEDVPVIDIPGVDISATEIRARVRAGMPIDFLVPREVQQFIYERGLYLDAAPEVSSG